MSMLAKTVIRDWDKHLPMSLYMQNFNEDIHTKLKSPFYLLEILFIPWVVTYPTPPIPPTPLEFRGGAHVDDCKSETAKRFAAQ